MIRKFKQKNRHQMKNNLDFIGNASIILNIGIKMNRYV